MAAAESVVIPGRTVHVRPRYADGRPKWNWDATLLHASSEMLVLRGEMNRTVEAAYVTFYQGDVMLERYWFDRWYNVFAVHDPSGPLKGWYANVCTPIEFDGETIRYIDLDLDLWVWPDRRYLVLDEEEFVGRVEKLMPADVVKNARVGLSELLADLAAGGELFQETVVVEGRTLKRTCT